MPTLTPYWHYECNELWSAPFKVLSGLGRKTRSSGEKLSASSLKDSSEVQSSINEDSPARSSEPLATDDMYRTSSPDTYLPTCTLDCPLTLPEERVKPHVVSLSACRDDELVYDDNVTGETSTKFFIDYLERNPEASYHDLLSYIRHKVDGITRRRTEVETTTHETRRQSEVEVLDWRKPDRVEKENEDSNLISQRPSYLSHYRLICCRWLIYEAYADGEPHLVEAQHSLY